MYALPTHHVALWESTTEVKNIAIATGLNICFLLIAKMYFDPIAKTPAQNNVPHCQKFVGGVITKAKIKAVIYKDSMLVGALKIFEKSLFDAQHTIIRKIDSPIKFNGENVSMLKRLNTSAKINKAIR